jgi:hypothetical protein
MRCRPARRPAGALVPTVPVTRRFRGAAHLASIMRRLNADRETRSMSTIAKGVGAVSSFVRRDSHQIIDAA